MTPPTIQEIETAVSQLTPEQLADFSDWFWRYDALVRQAKLEDWQAALQDTKGMWADHPDAPDARQLRSEWENRSERIANHD